MSIILQIGATTHVENTTPVICSDGVMGTGSEPDNMEASGALDDSGCMQPATSTVTVTYPNCFGLPYQDHNYGAPPPPTPPQSPAKVNGTVDEDTSTSIITTSTTNEEDAVEESVTRCICEFDHDDEYMICCDKCSVWQHVDCMGIDRNNIPETYMCEKCEPRKVDKQKAKALQTKKKEEMTDSSSDESGDENSQNKSGNNSLPGTMVSGKKKKLKQKKKEKVEEKVQTPTKRMKRTKEKVEPKKPPPRKRTKSKSLEVNHIDEDARDSWDSSLSRDWIDKYEEAESNQYSPEVHLQLSHLKLNGQHEELAKKISGQLQVKLCKVAEISKHFKGLVAVEDIRANEVICEYRGKFLLVSQFKQQDPIFNNRLHPYVLFYSFQKDQEDVCVDSREFGNDARFIRRSCLPNAEVRHIVENGSLHLYLISCKEIKQEEEITIPFDFSYEECIDKVDCPCSRPNCPVSVIHKKNGLIEPCSQEKKIKKPKKIAVIEEDSTQSSGSVGTSRNRKPSPLRVSQTTNQSIPDEINDTSTATVETEISSAVAVSPGSASVGGGGSSMTVSASVSDDMETEEQAAERRKKMTREERKMEAIMKAFARLEKAQQRRQETLARLAQKKEQEQEQKRKEEERKKEAGETAPEENKTIPEGGGVPSGDESKQPPLSTTAVVKQKGKGKKRKNSGTPSRRRSRMNSGGSDIMSPDESTQSNLSSASTPTPPIPHVPAVVDTTVPASMTPVPSSNERFKFPKTKKLLMSEWLSEKPEPVNQPLTIKTEPADLNTATPTCYMRCARSPTGISTAHLRRTSGGGGNQINSRQTADGSMGSAKKRWLRQAMYEEVGSSDQCSPIPNGAMSPSQGASSPGTSPPAVTPLKKRRLARESMSSDTLGTTPPSTPSPSVSGAGDTALGVDCGGVSCEVDEEDTGQIFPSLNGLQASVAIDCCDGLKTGYPEDTMYEDYYKKDQKDLAESGKEADSVATVESDDSDTERTVPDTMPVFNKSVAAESQEHLAESSTDTKQTAADTLSVQQKSTENNVNEEKKTSSYCAKDSNNDVSLSSSTTSLSSPSPLPSPLPSSPPVTLQPSSEAATVSESEQLVVMDDLVDSSLVVKTDSEKTSVVVCNNVDSELNTFLSNNSLENVDTTIGSSDAVVPVTTAAAADSSTGDKLDVKTPQCSSSTTKISVVVDSSPSSDEARTEVMAESTVEQSTTKPDSSVCNPSSSSSTSSNTLSSLSSSSSSSSSLTALPSSSSSSSSCAPSVNSASTSHKTKINGSSSNINIISTSGPSSPSHPSTSSDLSSEAETNSSHVTSSTNSTNGVSTSSGCSSSAVSTSPTNSSTQTTKRKVSLLEYRKRKLENQSSCKTSASSSTSTSTVSSTSVTSPSPNDPLKDLNSPLPRLLTLPLFESVSPADSSKDNNKAKKESKKRSEEEVRWSSAPTTVEQQRENLTQRLRREFGLLTDDESDTEKDRSALDLQRSRTPPPPPPPSKGKGFSLPPPGTTSEGLDLDTFGRTHNGRPIGVYPSHPPTPPLPLVRTGASNSVVHSIPTVIGMTGYQPPPRSSHTPVAGVSQPSLPPSQQYSYPQYSSHPSPYPPPQGSQQPQPPPYNTPQVVPQYSGPPPSQPRPSLPLRSPTPSGHGPPAPPPRPVGPPLGLPPPTPQPFVDQQPPLPHVQSQPLLRPVRPLLQTYQDPQHHYSAPPQAQPSYQTAPPLPAPQQPQSYPPPHQQPYYGQGYYQ